MPHLLLVLHFTVFYGQELLKNTGTFMVLPLQQAFLWQMLEDRRKSYNLSSISNEFFSYNYLIRADKTRGSAYDTLPLTAKVRALLITHRIVYTHAHAHTARGLQSFISEYNNPNNNMRGWSYNRQTHLSYQSGSPYFGHTHTTFYKPSTLNLHHNYCSPHTFSTPSAQYIPLPTYHTES